MAIFETRNGQAQVVWGDGLGLQSTFNSRVHGWNPNACSIYSIDGVIPSLGFLQKTQWTPSITQSQLVAHISIFRRGNLMLMYLLWPLTKKFQNWIVNQSTAQNFTVYILCIPDLYKSYLASVRCFSSHRRCDVAGKSKIFLSGPTKQLSWVESLSVFV